MCTRQEGVHRRRPWLKAPGDSAGLFVALGTSTRRKAGKPTALACSTERTCRWVDTLFPYGDAMSLLAFCTSVRALPSTPSSLNVRCVSLLRRES